MTAYEICLLALLVGALAPCLWLASSGEPVARLIGVYLSGTVIVFVLILFAQVTPGKPYDLILPLVLVPLSFAGTLVLTRLLAPHREADEK